MDPAAVADGTAGPPSRADRIGGPLWVVLGAAIAAGAWNIERMEAQGVPWFGVPGLVPGLLGLAIVVAGAALSLRAWRRPRRAGSGGDAGGTLTRVGVTVALCLSFAVGLVGHGLPFALATGLYLFVHISVLQWQARKAAGQQLRGLAVAAAVAVGAGVLIPLVFEQIFLVRLP